MNKLLKFWFLLFYMLIFCVGVSSSVFGDSKSDGDETLSIIEGLGFNVGKLDSSLISTPRLRLFFSGEEILRAKKRIRNDDEAKHILRRLMAEADEQLKVKIEPLNEDWWEKIKDKDWQETYPDIFQHTWLEPLQYAKGADTLATAWMLTEDPKYFNKSREMIMNLVSYTFRAEHYDVGMNYSVWGILGLRAYDVLWPKLTSNDCQQIDACMTRMARAVAKNDVYWIRNDIGGGINNHLAWHKMMLGLLGLFYGRADMIDYCISGPRGLVSLLEDGLLDDGLWCESSLNYHFAAIVPIMFFAEAQRRVGHEPLLYKITGANGRTLKQPFDAMFNVLAADGTIPPIGDTYGMHRKLWDFEAYEHAWAMWGDAHYAWLLKHRKERPVYSLFTPSLPPNGSISSPSIRSLLLPEHGYVFLRSHIDDQYWDTDAWCAFLTYDLFNVHSNADKLSLMLFGQKRMLLSDVEGKATVPHAFSSRIQRELNRGGLSQNTVMIDGQSQRYSAELLDLVEFRDLPDEKRVTAADFKGLLYEGVRQMRTIAMTSDYVLDVFQVDCGEKQHQIDWIAHFLNEKAEPCNKTKIILNKSEDLAFPTTGPWKWLRNSRSAVPAGHIQLGWHDGRARLRFHMLNLGIERVIFCDYPGTDEPDSPTIPMVIVRKQGRHAIFATVWLIGEAIKQVEITRPEKHEGKLVFEINADGKIRRHHTPSLK
ncbi:MAG: alginate lyase family protein [Planctomycetota bacterium]|jgi:hypothetical protein